MHSTCMKTDPLNVEHIALAHAWAFALFSPGGCLKPTALGFRFAAEDTSEHSANDLCSDRTADAAAGGADDAFCYRFGKRVGCTSRSTFGLGLLLHFLFRLDLGLRFSRRCRAHFGFFGQDLECGLAIDRLLILAGDEGIGHQL